MTKCDFCSQSTPRMFGKGGFICRADFPGAYCDKAVKKMMEAIKEQSYKERVEEKKDGE